MFSTARKTVATVAALGALALGGSAIAGAATSSSTTSSNAGSMRQQDRPGRGNAPGPPVVPRGPPSSSG